MPKEIRRQATQASHLPSIYGLPAEVLNTAVGRLGFLGLVVAVMFPASYWVEFVAQPERVAGPIPGVVAFVMLVLGAAVCVTAWTRSLPRKRGSGHSAGKSRKLCLQRSTA